MIYTLTKGRSTFSGVTEISTENNINTRTKLLIVDDEKLIRKFCRTILEKAGYEVIEASNGHQALAILRQNHIPVVISDIDMPEMSGLALLQEIKSIAPNKEVIIMTGSALQDHEPEAMMYGAFALLAKPFLNVSVLTEAVSRALDKYRSNSSEKQ